MFLHVVCRNFFSSANKLSVKKKLFFISLAILSLTAFAARPVREFPFVPSPPDASSYWIAEYLEHNTVPMQIRAFESKNSAADVVKYYDKWFSNKRGYTKQATGLGQLLGAKLGAYQVTVEVRSAVNGSAGTITAAAVYEITSGKEERAALIGKGLPIPVSSKIISDTLSYDPGKRNRTIIAKNTMSVEVNALYLREKMILLGWTLNQDKTLEGGTSSVLIFRKNDKEMIVTITKKDVDAMIISSTTEAD